MNEILLYGEEVRREGVRDVINIVIIINYCLLINNKLLVN